MVDDDGASRDRIESTLGRGGMGEVWLACDTKPYRRLALASPSNSNPGGA